MARDRSIIDDDIIIEGATDLRCRSAVDGETLAV
jgi:hypothetical protein